MQGGAAATAKHAQHAKHDTALVSTLIHAQGISERAHIHTKIQLPSPAPWPLYILLLVLTSHHTPCPVALQTRYTSADRLCGWGRSAGGLTVGASLNMRPDLWKVAMLTLRLQNQCMFLVSSPLAISRHGVQMALRTHNQSNKNLIVPSPC